MADQAGPSALGFIQVSSTSTSTPIDKYESRTLWCPKGARGVFGGQVIGQALHAALQTVSDRMGLHSMHIYFLLPADPAIPIIYAVNRVRDGKSYSTRFVRALQGDKVVALVMASYSAPPPASPDTTEATMIDRSTGESPITPSEEPAVSHSLRFTVESTNQSDGGSSRTKARPRRDASRDEDSRRMPSFQPRFALPCPDDILPMSECELEPERWSRFFSQAGSSLSPRRQKAVEEYVQERRESAWDIAVAKRSSTSKRASNSFQRIIWLKPKYLAGEAISAEDYKCVIACISDFQFIGTAARRLGLTAISNPRLGMLASLDHSIYFYPLPRDFDPSAPLLHVIEAVVVDTEPGRGVVRGRIYTDKGELIAVTMQEGVVRAGGRPKTNMQADRAKL